MEERANYVILIVGFPKTGKTTYLVELIKTLKTVLVFDFNNEEKYSFLPSMPPEKLPAWKQVGRFRIFNDDTDGFLEQLYAHAYNTAIVFEDSTAYVRSHIQDPLRKLIVSRRHRNLDLIFTFHSLNQVPPISLRNVQLSGTWQNTGQLGRKQVYSESAEF